MAKTMVTRADLKKTALERMKIKRVPQQIKFQDGFVDRVADARKDAEKILVAARGA
jgi:hypothetical protein